MKSLRVARDWFGFWLALVAFGTIGCSEDDPVVDVIPPGPPKVTTEPASEIGTTTTRLNARVFPNGTPTTVYFDLELNKARASTDSIGVEAGRDTVAVHLDVEGLVSSSPHRYRALAFNGFGDSEGEEETFNTLIPNEPPQTQVTAAPPDLNDTSFQVAFFWVGVDRDGEVVGFEWRMSDNGADGIVDVADTLGLAWRRTVVTDSVFVVPADMKAFPADTDRFWQTHTFFVRAIDDNEDRDATPASVSFTATTFPPEVQITSSGSDMCVDVTEGTAVQWTGSDPDASNGLPVDIRWILLEVAPPSGGDCWSQEEFVEEDPFADIGDGDLRWSDWRSYDLATEISLPSRPAGTSALVGVEARDAAGAITPGREWNVNVLAVRFTATQ